MEPQSCTSSSAASGRLAPASMSDRMRGRSSGTRRSRKQEPFSAMSVCLRSSSASREGDCSCMADFEPSCTTASHITPSNRSTVVLASEAARAPSTAWVSVRSATCSMPKAKRHTLAKTPSMMIVFSPCPSISFRPTAAAVNGTVRTKERRQSPKIMVLTIRYAAPLIQSPVSLTGSATSRATWPAAKRHCAAAIERGVTSRGQELPRIHIARRDTGWVIREGTLVRLRYSLSTPIVQKMTT
mmetsp:Transcript_106171/g.300244  ORF Transcript_106171/g.300244 Transcript_106171/m.300244 type:complete len:242 (-) Transcript_106171:291-1016(-)